MGDLSKIKANEILPEFQVFLLEKKLVPEKNVFFYALWLSKFFNYARKKQISAEKYQENTVLEFLETLKADTNLSEWQHRQANDAIRLYYFHYRGEKSLNLSICQSKNTTAELLKEAQRLIRLKHYSYSTERTYLQWIKRFLEYAEQTGKKETPDLIESDDCKNFLSHLALKEKVSSSTQNQAFNAILFLFRNVLCKEVSNLADTVRAKRGQKLPVVLSADEIKKILTKMTGKNRLIAELLYGAGLRLMELASLRVKDIDFDLNTIFVRSGKGDKDRTTILPLVVKNRLIQHLKAVKEIHDKDLAAGKGEVYMPDALSRKYPNAGKLWAWQYVFPSNTLSVDPRSGRIGRHHISDKSIQTALRNALKDACILKHATVHTLRHSFATHLLMNGVNIREVQGLLGHKNVETTMIYTHVMRDMAKAPKSPLDGLFRPRKTPAAVPEKADHSE